MITPLAVALASSSDSLTAESATGQEAVVALNTAFMTDGAVIRIDKGARLDKPLLLVLPAPEERGALVTTRNSIKLGDGARRP